MTFTNLLTLVNELFWSCVRSTTWINLVSLKHWCHPPFGSCLGQSFTLMTCLFPSPSHSLCYMLMIASVCVLFLLAPSDCFLLQQDLDSLFAWSTVWKLAFNLLKCKSMSVSTFSVQSSHIYSMNGLQLTTTSHYRDLARRQLHQRSLMVSPLFHHCFYDFTILSTSSISPHHSVHPKLFWSSGFTYCSHIWRLHLLKDFQTLERVQRCCTKFILNDYHSNYKDRLHISLKLATPFIPLVCTFRYHFQSQMPKISSRTFWYLPICPVHIYTLLPDYLHTLNCACFRLLP